MRVCLLILVLGAIAAAARHTCSYSPLWGRHGELWQPEAILPDFSYAGYHAGESPIPHAAAHWDLKKDFHAVGDGHHDDTKAFEKGLTSISNGVLFIPAGVYVISREIEIAKSDVVIRGAGSGKTVLFFPHSLTDLYGNSINSAGQSQWSFGPGFLQVKGNDPINSNTRLAAVVSPAKRGTRELTLSQPISVRPGEWVRLVESDPPRGDPAAGSLIRFLYGDLFAPAEDLIGRSGVVRFLSRIQSAADNRIELERPLPYDVRPKWIPEIHRFTPSSEEIGIEHLSIHFPWTPYPGHFKERGFNALSLDRVAHCWIDDVEIQNSDFAIGLNGTNFCTVNNVRLTVSADRGTDPASRGMSGHHGIDVSHGSENLIENFNIQTKFIHDISVEWFVLHTVFAHGRAVDLAMDHHREGNYASLFTDLDLGDGTRPFASGGSKNRGPHSGAYSTFWNLHAASPLPAPPPNFGPLLNFVGVSGSIPHNPEYHWTIEPASPDLCPANLYKAMRNRRLSAGVR